jgi:hypothetical protein
VSRGEGELFIAPKPRAVSLLAVCLTVKPVGEPDALIGHVRFDERGWETERCRMAQATAPILDSTFSDMARGLTRVRNAVQSGLPPSVAHNRDNPDLTAGWKPPAFSGSSPVSVRLNWDGCRASSLRGAIKLPFGPVRCFIAISKGQTACNDD